MLGTALTILAAVIITACLKNLLQRDNRNIIKTYVSQWLNKILNKVAYFNTKLTYKRIKNARVREPSAFYKKYVKVTQKTIDDLGLNTTVEGFTTLVLFIGLSVSVVYTIFVGNPFLGVLLGSSIAVAVFTAIVTVARKSTNAKLEKILDAIDMICPYVDKGVDVAIKKVLNNIDPDIREYFKRFLYRYEEQGYTFERAMRLLDEELGGYIKSFADKAIIFQTGERPGMVEIFRDVVDENAAIREVNMRKNEVFRKMDRDFWLKVAMLIGFIVFSTTVEGYRNFLIHTQAGRILIVITSVVIALTYAYCQFLQSSIGLDKEE